MGKEAGQSQLLVKGDTTRRKGRKRTWYWGGTAGGTGMRAEEIEALGGEVWCEAGCSRWTSGRRPEEGPA